MSDEPAPPARKRSPAWKIALNLLLFLGLTAIFVWQVAKNHRDLGSFHWAVNWQLALLALLLLLCCSTVDILIWNRTSGLVYHAADLSPGGAGVYLVFSRPLYPRQSRQPHLARGAGHRVPAGAGAGARGQHR